MTDIVKERRNAALCVKANLALDEVTSVFPFPEGADAVRFAVSYAVASELSPERPSDLGPLSGSNWNVATLDPSNEIGGLIRLLYPDHPDPYYLLETFMNVGLIALGERLSEDPTLRMGDLLADPVSE